MAKPDLHLPRRDRPSRRARAASRFALALPLAAWAECAVAAAVGGNSVVVQTGVPNSAIVMQSGPSDYSGVYQGGSSNQAVVNQGGYAITSMSYVPTAAASDAGLGWTLVVYQPATTPADGRLVEPLTDEAAAFDERAPAVACLDEAPGAEVRGDANAALHACDGKGARRPEVVQVEDGMGEPRPAMARRSVDVSDLAVGSSALGAPGSDAPIRLAHQ